MMRRERGFSLVEIVVVMVLVGIIGGVLAMQLGPTIQGYLAISRRAALTGEADTALRRIVAEVRSAVPNSLRQVTAQCVELVPTIEGGRMRTGPDVANAAAPGVFLDGFTAGSAFDVVSRFTNPVNAGDLVVIGSQNTDDLYGSNAANVATIASVTNNPPAATTGRHRITLSAPLVLPQGHEGGRFVVVPNNQRSVSYVCDAPRRDDSGANGTGILYRITRNALALGPDCPATTLATAAIVATNVEHCVFSYSPNVGATQESGFLQLQLTLRSAGESVPLSLGAHVDNVP